MRGTKGVWLAGLAGLLFFFAGITTGFAASPVISDARFWTAPDHTRMVLDLNAPVRYRAFTLHRPDRVVIDIRHARLQTRLVRFSKNDPVLQDVRYGHPKKGILRLVMNVREKVQVRSFLLKPMHGKPYRLVVDLLRAEKKERPVVTAADHARKPIVIVVDPGHGGEDPGASGPDHIHEKNITLAVGRRLAADINRIPGMRAVLTRTGDYFVPLRRRVYLARKAHADLMISIHADSVREHNVEGASVYTLSERGASDRVAALLAKKENSSDEIGGVNPSEVQDPTVQSILADLIKRNSLNSAELLAKQIIKQLGKVGPIKYHHPKHARFVVLTAAEIPSVLVELDYISNPHRERALDSRRHQKQLATALLDASEAFLRSQGRLPPVKVGTHHRIRDGSVSRRTPSRHRPLG